jgi:hypothetical protein
MSKAITSEVQAAFDAYVRLWHSLNVEDLLDSDAHRLVQESIAVSMRIWQLTGKRPGDFPEIMSRIG